MLSLLTLLQGLDEWQWKTARFSSSEGGEWIVQFLVHHHLVEQNSRNYIKLCIQQLRKSVLFYMVHQLHCQAGMTMRKSRMYFSVLFIQEPF